MNTCENEGRKSVLVGGSGSTMDVVPAFSIANIVLIATLRLVVLSWDGLVW